MKFQSSRTHGPTRVLLELGTLCKNPSLNLVQLCSLSVKYLSAIAKLADNWRFKRSHATAVRQQKNTCLSWLLHWMLTWVLRLQTTRWLTDGWLHIKQEVLMLTMSQHFTFCGTNWPPSKPEHKELFLWFLAVGTLTFFQESHTQAHTHTHAPLMYTRLFSLAL